ncbi:MAG: hypothetical protein ACK4UN_22055, partial [Limisphaerales bacterium]
LFTPWLGSVGGRLVSGMTLSALVLILCVLTIRWIAPASAKQLFWIGVLWFICTVTFEFLFGRLVAQKSWDELLAAYTFKGGNLWPLVLLWISFCPSIAFRVRGVYRGYD